jgi:hypothetical protein
MGHIKALDPLVPLGDVELELETVALDESHAGLGGNVAFPEVLLSELV